METTTRNATLADLAAMLKDQHARKVDVVAPARAVRSDGGQLVVTDTTPELSDEGVTLTEGRYRPTDICDGGVADKLGIPVAYLRKLREQRTDLYDANVNGWLHGGNDRGDVGFISDVPGPDPRSFLIRCFRGDDGGPGIARAFLSDSYRIIDNLDVLTAALDGVRQAGVDVDIDGCDLSERRMHVKVKSEAVSVLAPTLLAGYRSPFGGIDDVRRVAEREGQGYGESGEPVIFGGFVISNSETGGAAFTITPRLVVQVCKNGLTMTKDALRTVHLGATLDHGVIQWSEDTQDRNLGLVTAQARDAVSTFLDTAYVQRKIAELEEKSGTPVASPDETVKLVGRELRFTDAQTDSVLRCFIAGGQATAGGVMHAVTAAAQTVEDPEAAFDMEAGAVRALELAAS